MGIPLSSFAVTCVHTCGTVVFLPQTPRAHRKSIQMLIHENARHQVQGLLAKPARPMMQLPQKGLYGPQSQTRPCTPPTSDKECRISPDHQTAAMRRRRSSDQLFAVSH
ncbi:hypothetical protein LY78DRAFT_275619 [Colletotrichum sublineola]|nr:hypothetical protein LY78DRAFT_275619 [Colletotrichum sublineola]